MSNPAKTRSSALNLYTVVLLALALTACGPSDPREEALEKGVNLMSTIVHSRVLLDAVKNADPEMHASTAAGAALAGGITSNFQLPPDGIAMLTLGSPPEAWSVLINADDAAKQVIIEGYSDDLQTPLITKTIDFPPQ